ncbi:hypothetical protein GCM10027605_29740 [Micromonospora zhanjiangensis]
MYRRAAGNPKLTDPTASTATIRVSGEAVRKWLTQPISVPEVPVPTNRKSMSESSAVIAVAVHRSCTNQFAGFAYWFSHTRSGSSVSNCSM